MKTLRSRRHAQRGFSMLEMFVVMGILCIGGAIVFPKLQDTARDNRLGSCSRRFVGALRKAQVLAVTGSTVPGSGTPALRARAAGIRGISTTKYAIFVDTDTDSTNNNNVDVEVIDMPFEGNDGHRTYVEFTATLGQIRFGRDGSTTSQSIVMKDPGRNKSRTITITAGGQIRVD